MRFTLSLIAAATIYIAFLIIDPMGRRTPEPQQREQGSTTLVLLNPSNERDVQSEPNLTPTVMRDETVQSESSAKDQVAVDQFAVRPTAEDNHAVQPGEQAEFAHGKKSTPAYGTAPGEISAATDPDSVIPPAVDASTLSDTESESSLDQTTRREEADDPDEAPHGDDSEEPTPTYAQNNRAEDGDDDPMTTIEENANGELRETPGGKWEGQLPRNAEEIMNLSQDLLQVPDLLIEEQDSIDWGEVDEALGIRTIAYTVDGREPPAFISWNQKGESRYLERLDRSAYSNRCRDRNHIPEFRQRLSDAKRSHNIVRPMRIVGLVPAAIDRFFAAVQIKAIKDAGKDPASVKSTTGRYQKLDDGRYGLVVDRIDMIGG